MTQPLSDDGNGVPPEIRRHTAILEAKALLGRSNNVNAEHSMALAIQGCLVLLIEHFESQGDSSESAEPYHQPDYLPVPPLPTWGVHP